MAGGNEAQRSDRMKLLKNGVFNSSIHGFMFDINVMALGLLYAVTALPCLGVRLCRDGVN
ncbi:MAG: hypothetical protein LBC02_10385 [Planctomycetaceae bacterium]|nr:hypothetical protein [Planctomycetaceae bacterium]